MVELLRRQPGREAVVGAQLARVSLDRRRVCHLVKRVRQVKCPSPSAVHRAGVAVAHLRIGYISRRHACGAIVCLWCQLLHLELDRPILRTVALTCPIDRLLSLAAPASVVQLVFLRMVLGHQQMLLAHPEDRLRGEPCSVLKRLRVAVGDGGDEVKLCVGHIRAVHNDIGLLITQVVSDAIIVLVDRPFCHPFRVSLVADRKERVIIEQIL
mmetsp:Transcript_7082/g.15892  ORF Transcript_7082/g.15892 Transcript_7082/m.15892 type:complete len:212 (-) Transcript_7082:1681-2316(-)